MARLSTLGQLRVLMWKNFLLMRRSSMGTTLEIVIPAFLIIILWLIRGVVDSSQFDPTVFCSRSVASYDYNRVAVSPNINPWDIHEANGDNELADLPDWICGTNAIQLDELLVDNYTYIAFAPNTSEVAKIMANVEAQLEYMFDGARDITVVGFDTAAEVEDVPNDPTRSFLCGVLFSTDDAGQNLGLDPMHVHYTLRFTEDIRPDGDSFERWETARRFPPFEEIGPNYYNNYFSSGFAYVQASVDAAIIHHANASDYSGTDHIPFIPSFLPRLKPMPFPAYDGDEFIYYIRGVLPTILVVAFLPMFAMLTRNLVYEKERRLTEMMKIMGMANWVHWMSWFLKSIISMAVACIFVIIIFALSDMTEYSDNGIVFLLLLLFVISIIMLAFATSTLFKKANAAAGLSAVIFWLTFAPYSIFQQEIETKFTTGDKAGLCLLPASCLGIAANILSRFESSGEGLTWDTMQTAPSELFNFTMANVFGMLIVDIFLYMFLAWYLDKVLPGETGMRHPWYFVVQPSFWSKRFRQEKEHSVAQTSSDDDAVREPEPSSGNPSVKLEGLTKVFQNATGGQTVAVDNLSLNFYESNITAVLGRNGAGKTTALSVLVGLYPASGGEAYVYGNSISSGMDEVRQSLGICPQFDVLFDELTVQDHIIFFSRLKGLSVKDARESASKLSGEIDLQEKLYAKVKTLSGGQKRALSVANSLSGDSKVIILDEPTSGMDPYKRRQTWDLLLKYKQGRTLIITTHFMEEADVLGDRIAIMADGRLRTVGSSPFLKQNFGAGYYLTLAKGDRFARSYADSLVTNHVPDATVNSDQATEIVFLLPQESSSEFPALLQALESEGKQYGIDSFGISITTMEQVFLKAVEDHHNTDLPEVDAPPHDHASGLLHETTNASTFRSQLHAMLIKRMLYAKRYRSAVFTQVLLPLFFALIAILTAQYAQSLQQDEKPLLFTFTDYDENNVRISVNNSAGDGYSGVPDLLNDVLRGFGTKAMSDLQDELFDTVDTMLTSDPFFEATTVEDLSTLNMSANILNDADGYQTSGFYRKNILATTMERGPVWLRTEGNGTNSSLCQAWSKSGFQVPSMPIPVVDGRPYEFVLVAGDKNMYPRLSFSPSDPVDTDWFVYADPTTDTNLTDPYFFHQDGTLTWLARTYGQTDNQTVYLFCDEQQQLGIPLNVTDSDLGSPYSEESVVGYGWFSTKAMHSVAETINLLGNAAFRKITNDPDVTIKTTNHPLPASGAQQLDDVLSDFTGFNVAINMVFAGGFLMSSFCAFLISERIVKAKHVQFVSGVSVSAFWLANLIWDMLTLTIPAIGVVIIFAAFDLEAYRGERLGLVFLLMMLFGYSALPLVYVLYRIFKTPSGGSAIIAVFFIFVGLALIITTYIYGIVGSQRVTDDMKHGFLLIPNYALGQALLDMFTNQQYDAICDEFPSLDCPHLTNYADWEFPGVGQHMLYLFLTGTFWIVVLYLMETGKLRPSPVKADSAQDDESAEASGEEVDEDVHTERLRVLMGEKVTQTDSVVIRDVSKVFMKDTGSGKVPFAAVDHVSFGVKQGECFGLLGVNGAGKTTLFRMITGDTELSGGTIHVAGYDLAHKRAAAQRRMGYCPQFDALLHLLTGRELLNMFGRLRGIDESKLASSVDRLITRLDLTKHADKPSGTYSGGNKRKLSTAIALIGDPQIVLLDEPTTGMDPASRRFLWTVIQEVMRNGQSVILTSHSMEECEVLCSRLAIMVNGQFKCLGSPQHLKNKFGGSISLSVTAFDSTAENIGKAKEIVEQVVPSAALQAVYGSTLMFKMDGKAYSWSELFTKLEETKTQNESISNYTISQTSLEQVFLHFAAHQHEGEAHRHGRSAASLWLLCLIPPPGGCIAYYAAKRSLREKERRRQEEREQQPWSAISASQSAGGLNNEPQRLQIASV